MATVASKAYAAAGVDLTAAAGVKQVIGHIAGSTRDERVLSTAHGFCGVYDADPNSQFVYASSTDSVGTKVRIAQAMGRHDTIGIDLVHHCVNDILPSGAEPIFFLDYIGSSGFDQDVIPEIVQGLANACADHGCALIAGETASLPGMYQQGDYDLVGFIVGRAKRTELKSVETVGVGDVLVALPSSGLHTNGYSLIRQIFGIDDDPAVLETYEPDLGNTLGEGLLEPHSSYASTLRPVMQRVKTLAHITGGSFGKNVPRALPDGMIGRIDRDSWGVPPLFQLIQRRGRLDQSEMFSVFNMGVGMIAVVSPDNAGTVLETCADSWVIGCVVEGDAGSVAGVDFI